MSETGNGRKNWTRVVAAVGLVFLAVAIALLIGLLFGIVQGFLVSYLEIQPFIVSLAGMFFGRGMTSIISTDMISIKNKTFLAWANYKIYLPIGSYSRRGKFIPAYIYPTVIIAILIFIVIAIIMKYTKFGREVYAIGGNAQSAMMTFCIACVILYDVCNLQVSLRIFPEIICRNIPCYDILPNRQSLRYSCQSTQADVPHVPAGSAGHKRNR